MLKYLGMNKKTFFNIYMVFFYKSQITRRNLRLEFAI